LEAWRLRRRLREVLRFGTAIFYLT